MELRHIRCFLAIAEEGNFTRAAAKLGMSQPPLSMQIKDLESEVGAKLFHRVPHGTELTDAGRAFWEVAKGILDTTNSAVEAARRAALGKTGRLTLGYTGTSAVNPILPSAIRAFRRSYPEVELRLEEANSVRLIESLMEGRVDVAILRPAVGDPPEIHMEPLIEEALVAALPESHSVARGRGSINLSLLRDYPLILTPLSICSSLRDAVLTTCHEAGFDPVIGQPAPQIASILSLVAAEFGFALLPESMRQLKVRGVVYRSLRGQGPRVSLCVARPGKRPSVPALNFAELVISATADVLRA